MRILHLGTEKVWRGGENQMRLLIQGLNNQNVYQIAATPSNSIAFREKRWDCEIISLQSSNPFDPRNILRLAKLISENSIDIVDAHTAKAHTLALHASGISIPFKLVVHRRVDNIPKNNFLTKRKYLHSKVSRYVAISHAIQSILEQYGIPIEKISIVRSAVSEEPYQNLDKEVVGHKWSDKLRIPQQTVLIGNASALSPQKGYETLIHAAAELKKKTKNFKVLIAGDGVLKNELIEMVNELSLHDEVIFLGHIDNVPEFLTALDILAVPSNNEGLGTVILEGILAGCCPVGSDVGGIPEIIIPDQTGLLQAVGDFHGLAENLFRLIEEPDTRSKFSLNALDYVRNNFSLDSMVNGNMEVYQSVLSEVR